MKFFGDVGGRGTGETLGEADDADELRGDPRVEEAREDIFMKNSARTFVAWNFLTSDAAKSLPRIGNSDYISELSCSGDARAGARLLYAKRT